MRKIADHLPGVIFQFRLGTDGQTSFPFVSRQLAEVCGLAPESVRRSAEPLFALVHADDLPALRLGITESAGSLHTWRWDCRLLLPDGGQRWLGAAATPERQADGSVLWHGFASDTTEQRAQQQRIQAAEQQRLSAEQASRDKSLFLSRASHELRTPLNAVVGFSQLMLQDTQDKLPPLQQQRTEHVYRAGQHLLSLINDLLDLGRIDHARPGRPLQQLALGPLVDHCLQLLHPQAEALSLRIRVLLPPGAVQVQADAQALQQVLINLLSNAIKYNQPGGRLLVQGLVRGHRLRVSVSNDGPGLDQAHRRQLFQPFNRLGAEASDIPGSGLGLLITQQLVDGMDTRLRAHSRPGRGASFFFWLPLAVEPRREAAGSTVGLRRMSARARVLHPSALIAERRCVLYIEDDPVNQLLVREMLAATTHWEVVTACNGDEGLARAAQHRPAVVLTDMHLPGMTGLEVLQALRADRLLRHTPCVALSADALPEQLELARAAGFDAYLTKPIAMKVLVDTLASCMARSDAEQERPGGVDGSGGGAEEPTARGSPAGLAEHRVTVAGALGS
jgi:signal transduction histidine kinase/CheY-like chemotaxis protein